jgi:transcriptional regulatory protein RtcR
LVQHEDSVVHRLELIYTPRHEALAQGVKRDIASVSPETEVRLVAMDIADPWDFGEMYGALYDWVRGYTFKPDTEQYWTHITTGTHVAQICMFLMVESRFIPGVLLQTAPPKKQTRDAAWHLRPHRPGPVALRRAGPAIRAASSATRSTS